MNERGAGEVKEDQRTENKDDDRCQDVTSLPILTEA